jgi:hypothetical protein
VSEEEESNGSKRGEVVRCGVIGVMIKRCMRTSSYCAFTNTSREALILLISWCIDLYKCPH